MSRTITLAVLSLSLFGCRGETSKEPPIVAIRNMFSQPKYSMQQGSEFFADKRAMRPQVEGTVSRETDLDSEYAQGRLENDSGYVLSIPKRAVDTAGSMSALLARGKERYGIYCTPCHDGTGSGGGIVIKRGMLMPPTFHQDRLRHIPDGQLYATVTNGIRNMPPYGPQTTIQDRWGIVAYVRALQLSQPSDSEKKP